VSFASLAVKTIFYAPGVVYQGKGLRAGRGPSALNLIAVGTG
jgi:hypothetical protein